jgi:hypothetical protein
LKVQVGAELAAERKQDNLHTINIFLHPSSSSDQSASRWDCDNTPCLSVQQIRKASTVMLSRADQKARKKDNLYRYTIMLLLLSSIDTVYRLAILFFAFN